MTKRIIHDLFWTMTKDTLGSGTCALPDVRLSPKFDPASVGLKAATVAVQGVQVASIFLPVLRLPSMALGVTVSCGLDPCTQLKARKERQAREALDLIKDVYAPHYVAAYGKLAPKHLDDPAKIRLSLLPNEILADPAQLPAAHRAEALKTQLYLGLKALGWKTYEFNKNLKGDAPFRFYALPDGELHTEAGVSALWQERTMLDALTGRTKPAVAKNGLPDVAEIIRGKGLGLVWSGIRQAGEMAVKSLTKELPKSLHKGATYVIPTVDAVIGARTVLLEVADGGVPATEDEFVRKLFKPLLESRHQAALVLWRNAERQGAVPKQASPDIRIAIERNDAAAQVAVSAVNRDSPAPAA